MGWLWRGVRLGDDGAGGVRYQGRRGFGVAGRKEISRRKPEERRGTEPGEGRGSAFLFHCWGSRKPFGWHNLQDRNRWETGEVVTPCWQPWLPRESTFHLFVGWLLTCFPSDKKYLHSHVLALQTWTNKKSQKRHRRGGKQVFLSHVDMPRLVS